MNKICIANVYRPPQGNVQNFCDILEEQIVLIKNKYRHDLEICIMGDFNINYLGPREPNAKILKWIEHSTGLRQLIKSPTRYSTIDSCIDLIFTNCQNIKCHTIHDLNINDLQMISLTRKHLAKPSDSNSFLGRSYKNNNKELFCNILQNYNWNTFHESADPSDAWSILYNVILKTDICPQKLFHIKKMRDPWISDEIMEILYEKDRLLNKAKRTRDDTDKEAAKIARHNANILLRNSKSDFIKENLELHKNDAKQFWKHINTILPKKK